MSTRAERQAMTREALVATARTLFLHDGYGATSLDRVALEAGFSKGAVYSNFKSKEALFIALADRQVRSRLVSLERAVSALTPGALPAERLDRDAIRSLLAAVTSDPGDERHWYLMTTEFELLALRDPEVGTRWLAQQQALQGELTAALPRLLGELGLRFVVDPRTAVDVLLTAYEAGVRESFFTGSADRPGRALEVLVDLLVTDNTDVTDAPDPAP